jgi:preprotein translocase subunit SecD
MKIRPSAFNIYLILGLALLALGCQTSEERQKKKQITTLRFFREANHYDKNFSQQVTIGRHLPMLLALEKSPFLHEAYVTRAEVTKEAGDTFAIRVQFDRHGAWLLEQVSAANIGRRIAISSQFDQPRWLAAPVVSRRITDGVLVFTPDASREEAERIVRGLNNVAAKNKDKFFGNP